MDQRSHLAAWDVLRMRHGITLRVIDQLSNDQLTSRPVAGMRTPVELLVHLYTTVETFPEGVLKGAVPTNEETAVAAGITTRAQLLDFVRKAWASADEKVKQITPEQLKAMVSTPWGESYPGAVIMGFVTDEYVHHRGQLYAFVRVFGMEPVMVYDFEHNAAEYQPRQLAVS